MGPFGEDRENHYCVTHSDGCLSGNWAMFCNFCFGTASLSQPINDPLLIPSACIKEANPLSAALHYTVIH